MYTASVGTCGVPAISHSEDDASFPYTAIVKKHNRRNTEPIQSRSLQATLTSAEATTGSWGSIFDFSSILFPGKKLNPHEGHSGFVGNGHSYLFPLGVKGINSSPSTASYSGDEDYDSSISSDSNDRTQPAANKNAARDIIDKKYSTFNQFISPITPSPSNDKNDYSCQKHFASINTNSIAAQWISMASATLPERESPTHFHNQFDCESGVNSIIARNRFACNLTCVDEHQYCQVMLDPCISGSSMSTPRNTNNFRNFQCGTDSTSGVGCTNNKHAQKSNSSREFNEGKSNSSFPKVATGRGGESLQEGTSNGNMSDDEGSANESSDDEDDNESLSDSEDAEEDGKLREEAALWKTAVDPKSGRTYYYNTKTLETQWRKPLCCASPSERRAAIKKERQTLAFFASMEQNILRTIQQQQPRSANGELQLRHSMIETSPRNFNEFSGPQHRRESEPPASFPTPFKLIRTISSMEDSVLAGLVQRVPSFRNAVITSKNNVLGGGATFTSFSRTYDTATDATMYDGTPDDIYNEKSNDTVRRHTAREDSLPFGAIIDATRSQRCIGLDYNDGSSFNFSALMRRSSQHNSRFNMFEYIPEEENEDNSESCSNRFESSAVKSPTRGNKSLTRQSGFIDLKKSLSRDESNKDKHDEIDDHNNQFSYRDSLHRTNGTLALRVDLSNNFKEPIARENSLNLVDIAGERQMKRDPSLALQDVDYWGSYLSESALRGLSIDEGEAMLELASITYRMGGIDSETSDFSQKSVGITNDEFSSENVEPGFASISCSIENKRHGTHSSDELVWDGTPELFADKQTRRESNMTSRPSMIRPTSLRNSPAAAILESITTKSNTMEKPSILRRNTCGTLYVGSTLSAPDKDATIKCVCAVYRAHILQSSLDNDNESDDKYEVFDDLSFNSGEEKPKTLLVLPTLEDISIFYRDVFSRAQMESDCIIISLIYVERLIKVTNGALRPHIRNWRSILFSCMVMASKVWDDLSMWNADFSQTCPAGVEFQLSRINELEIAVLSSLQYKVKVPASEYAKYYFLLRSMLIKSGLGSEDLKTINPLDVEGAKQLQHISSQYQASVALMSDRQKVSMGRSKTTGGAQDIAQFSIDGSTYSDSSNSSTPLTSPTYEKQQRTKVGLEHMVQL